MDHKTRHILPAIAIAALTLQPLLVAGADTLSPSVVPASPLATARTISVKEAVYLTGSGSMQLFFTNTVNIQRPDRVRVIFNQSKPGQKPHQYYMNGKVEREYDALTNQYSTIPPAQDGSSMSSLRDIAKIDLILNGVGVQYMSPEVKVSHLTGEIDGEAMNITAYYPPSRMDQDGDTISFPEEVWTNAKTGILSRWVRFLDKNGKITPFEDVEFSHWVLNKTIPDSELAWAPPAGSTPFSPPVLLPIGALAPDFAVTQSNGTLVHLSDFKGKVVVLDFWATWCGPCQMSMPHLEQVYQAVKNDNVAVLGVCVWDQKAAYDKWVAVNIGTKYNFPVAFDSADRSSPKAVSNMYRLTGIPTQYVIGPDGRVSSESVGYSQGDHDLENNLNKLGVAVKDTATAPTQTPASPAAAG